MVRVGAPPTPPGTALCEPPPGKGRENDAAEVLPASSADAHPATAAERDRHGRIRAGADRTAVLADPDHRADRLAAGDSGPDLRPDRIFPSQPPTADQQSPRGGRLGGVRLGVADLRSCGLRVW